MRSTFRSFLCSRIDAALLAACVAFALPVLASADGEPSSSWDVELDLDESHRELWASVLSVLSDDGARTLGVASGISNETAEQLWADVQVEFPATAEDCRGFYYVQFKSGSDVDESMKALEALPGVEHVIRAGAITLMGNVGQPTPALGGLQTYYWGAHLGSFPAGAGSIGGHDLPAVRQWGGGSSVNVAVLEFGAQMPPWVPTAMRHEDLPATNLSIFYPIANDNYVAGVAQSSIDHGTATLGVLCAQQDDPLVVTNGPGITGAVPNAHVYMVPFESVQNFQHLAIAITSLIGTTLHAGDVINLSLGYTPFGGSVLLPVAANPSSLAAIQAATAAGVYVVEAAGNGGAFLNPYAIPDDGALWVGAFDPTTGMRMGFSNYGSQVKVCSWGTNVTTLGYGDAPSGPPNPYPYEYYTESYSGTSSAAAIVSGLVASSIDAWRVSFQNNLNFTTPNGAVPVAPPPPPKPAILYSALRALPSLSGFPGFQNIGFFPDAGSVSRRIGAVPYGLGWRTNCQGPSSAACLAFPPTLANTWIETCATGTPRLWGEPAIGGTLAVRLANVSPVGSTTFLASASAGITPYPGFPGQYAFLDATNLIPLPFPWTTNSLNCSLQVLMFSGHADYTFAPIPASIPPGTTINLCALSIDSSNVEISNGLRIFLQN